MTVVLEEDFNLELVLQAKPPLPAQMLARKAVSKRIPPPNSGRARGYVVDYF